MPEKRKTHARRVAAGKLTPEEIYNATLGPESWAYQQGADVAQRGVWPTLPTPDFNRPVNQEQATKMAENIANLSPMGPMAGMVRGVNAMKYGNQELDLAKELHAAGAKNREITQATGWHLGPDKKWREEFSDAASKLNEGYLYGPEPGKMAITNFLSDVIDHPEFFKSYPSLRDLWVHYDPRATGGEFISGKNSRIILGGAKQVRDPVTGKITEIPHSRTAEELRSTLLHEMQHAVQTQEGFLRGGGPEQMNRVLSKVTYQMNQQLRTMRKLHDNMAPGRAKSVLAKKIAKLDRDYETLFETPNYEAYKALYGEAEARAVQRRMYLWSEAARRNPGIQFLDTVRKEKPREVPDYLYRGQSNDVYLQKPFTNWEELQKVAKGIK